MKKRFILLACALALLVGCLVMSSMAATNKTGPCEACGLDSVTWEPIKFGRHTEEPDAHKHYYFDKDYNNPTTNNQITIPGNNMTVCIDLNGKTWYNGSRAFLATYSGTADAPVGSTINIMDSVGGAVMTSRSEKLKADAAASAGGALYVDYGCTMNIYGGTFKVDTVDSGYGLNTSNGGVAGVYPGATLNIYDGMLMGAPVKNNGGAVVLYSVGGKGGTLNMYGGTLTSGSSEAGYGPCVGTWPLNTTAGCKVNLSGNAQVANIYLPLLNTENLSVSGTFTGSANLTYATTVANGTVVGKLESGADISGSDIYCTNGDGHSVAADGGNLVLAAANTEDVRHQCPHCNTTVKWEPFTGTAPTAAGSYHYYLSKDYATSETRQFSLKAGTQVCLDLYGHTYETRGRAFDCETAKNVTLSILDSQDGGKVTAYSGDHTGGGVVIVTGGSTFNHYSGTLEFIHDSQYNPKWGGVAKGGVIQSAGTVNIYGGKIVGGDVVETTYEYTVEGAGGAIYQDGTLNILGGEITMGSVPESGAGPCIYVTEKSTVKTTLGGNAKVADIYFAKNDPSKFVVNKDFIGEVFVSYAPSVVLTQGSVIGTFNGITLEGTVAYSGYTARVSGGELILSAYPIGTVAATGDVGYTTLQEALDEAEEGALVELIESVTDDVTVNKNITLQLNNCSINGTVTVTSGHTLYGMDSATDDYTVADGAYGKIAKVEGNVVGAVVQDNSYLKITESAGVSFHCVTLDIYAMSLRADEDGHPGLYYKSHFKADEKAAPLIDSYGVALSVKAIPTADNLDTACRYSVIAGFEAGPMGNLGNNSSTLLKGILKGKNTDATNTRNMNVEVYGKAYAKTTDGQCLMGQYVSRSLAEQLTAIDGVVANLSENQTSTVVNIYKKFKSVLSNMPLDNIAEAVQTNEEGTLKILVLGNSHSLDATNLLYEVFHNEAPDQKVVIGALYYSGCRMFKHKEFLSGNEMVYTYHKNDGTQTNRTWVVKSATCLEALQDEQWDYIFMQQMNHRLAMESEFTDYYDSWKYVADYLLNNQDITPKLGFHVTWTNPDDYELYLNDNAPYATNEGRHTWRTTHEQAWRGADDKYDKSLQYQDINKCVKKYLIDGAEDLIGRNYDLFIPSATVIEYAETVCGRQQKELYRDYTHMNDYGRLMTAYVWYAQIMGIEELDTIKVTEIPAALKHQNSLFPEKDANGKYTIDTKMQEDLIESVNWALKNPWGLPEQ